MPESARFPPLFGKDMKIRQERGEKAVRQPRKRIHLAIREYPEPLRLIGSDRESPTV